MDGRDGQEGGGQSQAGQGSAEHCEEHQHPADGVGAGPQAAGTPPIGHGQTVLHDSTRALGVSGECPTVRWRLLLGNRRAWIEPADSDKEF